MADNLFHPNCRKKGGSLDKDALNFISRVYQDTSFDGLIALGTKDSDGNYKDIGPVPCTQIVQFAEEMTILTDHDYYISSNIFTNEIRSKDTLLAINAIVIDVDCHSKDCPSGELEQRIEALICRLQNDCFDCGDLPHPHYIVLTGRGIQLWWCVVPAHARSFSGNFSDVEHYFASKIDNLISEFPDELLGFSVDPVASSNAAGLFRLPGTVNTHCQKKVEAIFFPEQRLNLKDFRDQVLPVSSRSSRRRNVSIYFRPHTQDALKAVLLKRLDAIETLRSMRDAPAGSEARNNFCLIYYAMAKPIYGDAEAYHRTQDFNAGFRIPLTEKELKGCLCSARRKNYKYSTQAIMQKLDIGDDEADRIGLHIAKAKPSSKEKKENRDRRIIDLFNQGFLQKEIAEELKISCSTVSRVINANPGEIDTLSNQIQRLLQSGKTPAEVSRELHCSVRTVERGKISPSKSSTSAHSKCDKNFKNTFTYGLSFRGKGGTPTPGSKRSSVAAVDEGRQIIKQAIAAKDKHSDYFGKIDLYEPFINGSISFTDNDTLANVKDTAPARIEAAVLGALIAAEQEGNLYISCVKLRNHVNGFLQYYSALVRSWTPLTAQQVSDACNALCQKGMVVADQSASEGICYFLKDNHIYEKEATELLTALLTSQPRYTLAQTAVFQAIQQYETEAGFTLSQEQQEAILLAITEPVSIITGGPGTGKTATMAALCHVLKNAALKAQIELCAPTGKAAVHLSTVTGTPAKTIHSLKRRKINCDFLIVDEASMVDMALLHDMLKMISKGAHVLFVGDSNQLPCIGGGNALRDMINCKKIPTVSLNQVYRQSEQNGIVSYANMIWATQESTPFPQSRSINNDICFIRLQEASEITEKVAKIVESLKNMGNLDSDIQVLAPTREWARNLNLRLKSIFNPVPNEQKREPFSVGDRIIYTENNYARKLHNGQEGMISSVAEKTITVCYGGQIIRHTKADMEHLELSYALTIHKAQGSEYPVVIIPVHTSMGRALNRNMIYTAVTRARRKCIIVGSEQALRMALDTTLSDTHRSLLAERLSQT